MAWSSSLKSLLTVFVFTVLAVSSVESYQCAVFPCESEHCAENADVCTASNGCFSEIQKFDTPSSATNQMFKQKGCSKDPCSDLEFSATLGAQRRFTFVNRCCTSDNCNKDNITREYSSGLCPSCAVSQASEEANGIQCIAYYEEPGTQGLLSFLNCTGNETKCVAVIGTVGSSHPFAFVITGMGCATESACNKSMTVLNSTNILTFCSREFAWSSSVLGSTGLRPASISTVLMLILLLLLKVLL